MASATLPSVSMSLLQSRQMSGSLSSSSGMFIGDKNAFMALSSSVASRAGQPSISRGSIAVVMSQQHHNTNFGSKADTLAPSRWVQGPMLAAADAVSAANAVRAVTSPTLPLSTWDEARDASSQGARCSWPKPQNADQKSSVPVLFFKEDQVVEEGQQLHEEFAGELIKRSKSENLLLESEEAPLGPRSPWPREGVSTESVEQVLGPRSAWPRVAASTESVERVLGPRCAWPREGAATPLSVEPEDRVLGPRCEFPRRMVPQAVVAPLVVAGAACAWSRQSQSALAEVIPDSEALYPRCDWPRKEVAMEGHVEAVEGFEGLSAKRALKTEGAKGSRPMKVKKESQGWPWSVVPVGLEPVPDAEVAEGPRCAWPRVPLQLPVEKPLMLHETSDPAPAGPRCAWPAKQATPSVAAPLVNPSQTLGPRCALKVAVTPPAPVAVSGAACAWPREGGVQAVTREEPRPLGPRCALKIPEERSMGPRCALKTPPEPVLGPRCALKLPVEEEVKVEGPRCAWPKPGFELVLAEPVVEEEKESVAPEKVQKKRLGLLPRRGLFTRVPVKYAKSPTLARVGKVKVVQPQPEVGKGVAQPAEKVKVAAGATWPRRLLATSLGLGALNEALVRSQAQAAVLESPAVRGRRLESYRTDVQSAGQDTSS